MDELESQSVPDATVAATEAAGDDDANGPSSAAAVAAAVTTATTMILASSSADVSTTRKPSGEFDVIVETPCDSGSLPDSSCSAAPLSWKPPAAAAEAAAGSRSTETREVHHVTFAEPCNKYVHSDSGIVLSPDDSDVNDVNVDGQSTELTDDECDEVTGGQAAATEDGPVRCPAPTNALPGPPIIKLHRCRSNESQDNPFLFDGELRRKADYIIAHSTILRTYVRIADPDQIPVDQQQQQQSTSDPELHPVTAGDDATEPQASELAAGLTNGEGGLAVVSPESPSATPQKVASKELSAPVRNGEAEEPLLCRKKEENNLESSPKKHTRSKKQICCVVQ